MQQLSLEAASVIIDAGLAQARRSGMSPMCIVVLDAGAQIIALKREDEAGFMRSEIASAKAKGALGLGCSSREIGQRAAVSPLFYTALFAISDGAIAPSAGGVLVRNAAGRVIGAVGVSGDKPDADEACAMAGIAAAGLMTDAGAEEAPDPSTR